MFTQLLRSAKRSFVPKMGVLCLTAAILSACQSTAMTADAPKPSNLPFADNASSTANYAKATLLDAMRAHQAQERYVLSTYHNRVHALHTPDSIDAGADPVWTTALKTIEYKSTQDAQHDTDFGMDDGGVDTDYDAWSVNAEDDAITETDTNTVSASGSWFDHYKKMKTANTPYKGDISADDLPINVPTEQLPAGLYGNLMSAMLDYMKQSQAQLDAKNLYQYDNSTITVLSHHVPAARKIDMLMALDYHSAALDQSVQLPVSLDFEHDRAVADVSAALPLMAFIAPQHTPLPQEIPNGLMRFSLPKTLDGALPMSVVYDALNRSLVQSLAEFDSESFTPVDAHHDAYAKELGASSVIKLNFDSKAMGKQAGVALKILANELKAYVDAHPDKYTAQGKFDASKIKQAIDDWLLINQGYHSDDLGSIFALVESVLPMNFNGSIYYYLDSRGRMIGMQSVQAIKQPMLNVSLQTIGQTRYSDQPFRHAYADKLAQSFTGDAKDGNAWLANIRQENKLARLAAQQRASYVEPNHCDAQFDQQLNDGAELDVILSTYYACVEAMEESHTEQSGQEPK